MDKRLIYVGLFAFALVFAGCTIPGSGGDSDTDQNTELHITTNDGLTITFQSQTPEYYTGDSRASLEAQVQNTGESTAVIESAALFGASWAEGAECRGGCNAELQGVETANNLNGDSTTLTFSPSLNGINLQQGQSDTYNIGLRVEYEYESRTRSRMTLMSEDQFRQNRDARAPMSNTIRAGPVQIRFTGLTPFPDRDSQLNIPVQVTNVGDGQIKDEQITLTVQTENDGIQLGNCDTVSGTVFDGQRTFNCILDTSNDAFEPAPEETVTLIATAEYTYVEDDTTSVRVIGEN